MKRAHAYRITVEHLATPDGAPPAGGALVFEARNHDDIPAIVRRLRGKGILPEDQAAALAVGLKLFTEVMLERRGDPLFEELRGPMRDFIGRLKRAGTPGG